MSQALKSPLASPVMKCLWGDYACLLGEIACHNIRRKFVMCTNRFAENKKGTKLSPL
jgi:hypothetical protein